MASGNVTPDGLSTIHPVVKSPLTDTFQLPMTYQGKYPTFPHKILELNHFIYEIFQELNADTSKLNSTAAWKLSEPSWVASTVILNTEISPSA